MRMMGQFNLEIVATPEQLQPQSAPNPEGNSRRIIQVYQRRGTMPKAPLSVPEPVLDSRIHRTESLVGKYDSAVMMDANLSDPAKFPHLHWQKNLEIKTFMAPPLLAD